MRRAFKSDAAWSYKFRVLKAEIVAFASPTEALETLQVDPPAELASGEFAGRRKLVEGLAYAQLGDFTKAELCLEKANSFAGDNDELKVNVAVYQGYLSYRQHHNAEAEKQYSTAIALARQHGLDRMEGSAHISLGKLFMDQEFYDQALNEFHLGLPLAYQSKDTTLQQRALGNMGWSYLELGDYKSASMPLSQAEETAAKIKDVASQELWNRDLGILYYVQHDYSQAETYYRKSLDLAKQDGDKDALSISYHNLAELELKRGRIDKAENYNGSSYAAKGLPPEDTSDPYLLLTTAEIAQAKREFPKAEQCLVKITHITKDGSLLWQAVSDLANVYVAEGDNVKAEARFDQTLKIVENFRGIIKKEDHKLSILDAWPFYDDYVSFLIHEGKQAKALQVTEFSRGRTLAESAGITEPQKIAALRIPAIKNFLRKENQTILAYWLSSPESYLWVIDSRHFELFHLPEKKKIEDAIAAYTSEIHDRGNAESRARGQSLYEMLVKPAEPFLSQNDKVVIVPNRGINYLNFETLVVPGKTPHYWIEDAVVENASSIALLVAPKHRSGRGLKKLLLMGDPVQATDEFPSLRFARDEIMAVQSHFLPGQETALTGAQATPDAYRETDPAGYQFIHLVTHGTRSETSPLDSAIILSPGPDKSFKLYARTIKDIGPLRADLVTISACYSAGEKASSGEGLIGLAWAFMRAGAHQVVAALWEVDDSITPKLMDSFYSKLESGMNVPEALRSAKLEILHSPKYYNRPYYWASLQLYVGS